MRQFQPSRLEWGTLMPSETRAALEVAATPRDRLLEGLTRSWWLGVVLCLVPGCLDPLIEDPGASPAPQDPAGLPGPPGNAAPAVDPDRGGEPVAPSPIDPIVTPTSTDPAPPANTDGAAPPRPSPSASSDDGFGELLPDAGTGDAGP